MQLRFRSDEGRSVTIDFDDQSGLLIGAKKGKPFFVDNPDNKLVVLMNDASDDAVLRVEWLAGGGCAPNYVVRIDRTARTMQIEGPAPGSDSMGGNCDLTLTFSKPVPAGEVEAVLVYTS
jgi:hypothetical protein